MHGKTCTKCGKFKELSEFNASKNGRYGKRSECKKCQSAYKKKWNKKNAEHKREYEKEWRKKNIEHVRAYDRERNKSEKRRKQDQAQKARRRALKHALPYSTSSELWLDVIATYDFKCAVTGKGRFDLEHMIPLAVGWGGSLKNNIYPMDKTLNMRKSAKNPFKFLKELKGQQRTNFEKVLHNLAKENGLTYKEYKKFVNWCFAHPRTLEEVLEDNKLGLTQVELWKLRRN